MNQSPDKARKDWPFVDTTNSGAVKSVSNRSAEFQKIIDNKFKTMNNQSPQQEGKDETDEEVEQAIRDAENYDAGYWDGFKAGTSMRWKYFFKSAMGILLFPLYFPMMLPIEYPLWKTYKSEGYNVPNYLKFFWDRCVILIDKSYTNGSSER